MLIAKSSNWMSTSMICYPSDIKDFSKFDTRGIDEKKYDNAC